VSSGSFLCSLHFVSLKSLQPTLCLPSSHLCIYLTLNLLCVYLYCCPLNFTVGWNISFGMALRLLAGQLKNIGSIHSPIVASWCAEGYFTSLNFISLRLTYLISILLNFKFNRKHKIRSWRDITSSFSYKYHKWVQSNIAMNSFI
jgi:hypothetical protein